MGAYTPMTRSPLAFYRGAEGRIVCRHEDIGSGVFRAVARWRASRVPNTVGNG